MKKLDYKIGFQEHDLDKLQLITYHKINPTDSDILLCKSYDQDGNYEGYQHLMYLNVTKKNNPCAEWEIPLVEYLINTTDEIRLLHVAYDLNHNVVRKDLRVSFQDVPNLLKYYPDLECIQEIDLVSKMGFSPWLSFQFYADGNLSIEIIGLKNLMRNYLFFEACGYRQLLTKEQIEYVKSIANSHRRFTVKFKWKNNKLNRKFYVRDVYNWMEDCKGLTDAAACATIPR